MDVWRVERDAFGRWCVVRSVVWFCRICLTDSWTTTDAVQQERARTLAALLNRAYEK